MFERTTLLHRKIYNQIVLWLFTMTLLFFIIPVTIFFTHFNELSEIFNSKNEESNKLVIGLFNKKMFNAATIGLATVAIVLTFMGIIFFGVYRFKDTSWRQKSFFIVLLLSTILISLYIGLSGGFLDSPFSGAYSIFVGNMILVRKKNNKMFYYKIFPLLSVLLIIAPYVHCTFCYFTYKQPVFYMFNWKQNSGFTWLRLAISILITFFTIVSSGSLNKSYDSFQKQETPA